MAKKKKFYGMGNDYMFRAVLQKSEETLRHLVAALMQMDVSEIKSCRITNPIILGRRIKEKEIILDVNLILNDDSVLNIELQMQYNNNWTDRSLYYWARTFTQLKRGEDYSNTKPTYHIGILDFSLFPEEPEFYAEYRIQNVKTGRTYNEKFCIRTLDLTRVEEAQKSREAEPELIKWARIVKAKTIKELESLAGDEEALKHMVSTVKKLGAIERIRQQCQAREDYERIMLTERNAGYRNGHEEGFEEGKQEGKQQGIQDAVDALDKLLTMDSITPEAVRAAKEKLLESSNPKQ